MPLNIVRCYHELYRLFLRCHGIGNIVNAFITEAHVRVELNRSFVLTCLKSTSGYNIHDLEFNDSSDPVLKSVEISSSEEQDCIVMKLYLCRQLMSSTIFQTLDKANSFHVMEVLNNVLIVFVPSVIICGRRKVVYDIERLLFSVRGYASIWGFNPKELVFTYEQLQFVDRVEKRKRVYVKRRCCKSNFHPPSTTGRSYVGISLKSQVLKFHNSN